MTRNELNRFIRKNISEQGNASSIALNQFAIEPMKHVPCTVHISSDKTEDLDKTTYDGNYTLLLSKEESLSELSHTTE